MALTATQLKAIATAQAAYFAEHGAYQQVFLSEKLGYEVHVYDGPKGHGFIVRETRLTADGKTTEAKATDYGPEERSQSWTMLTAEQVT